MSNFKRAVKAQSYLRLALAGPAGSGKTYTALALATALADGAPVAVIDTERGSASKYADLFGFDVVELAPPYHPDRYIEILREAEAAGYAVLVMDSLTHAWTGQGGLLEVHEQVVKRQTTKNSYTAWAEVTPIQNRFIDAITGARLHVIATMRSKSEYVQDQNERGRAAIRKVGTAPIQRDGMEFEFDIVGELDQDNTLVVSKSRCPALASAVIAKPGKPMADTLRTWLSGAPAPTPQPTAKPAPAAPHTETPHESADTSEANEPAEEAPAELMSLAAIHAKAAKAGLVANVDAWDEFCKQHAGKTFADIQNTKDAAAKAKLQAAVLAAANRDLSSLNTGHGRH